MGEGGSTLPPTLVPDLLSRCTFPPAGAPLACAVSGGADSLALLVLAAAAGCDVTAIHVDHGLRAGSAAEAEVVRGAAARFGARFESHRVSVRSGPNLEARARAARFAALPADVATGHTMDDQAETILINLLRGAGADGLAGMEPGGRHPLLAPATERDPRAVRRGGPGAGVRREQRRPGVRPQPGAPRAPPALRGGGRSRPRPAVGPAGRRAARRGRAPGRAGGPGAARPRGCPGGGRGGPGAGPPGPAAVVARGAATPSTRRRWPRSIAPWPSPRARPWGPSWRAAGGCAVRAAGSGSSRDDAPVVSRR